MKTERRFAKEPSRLPQSPRTRFKGNGVDATNKLERCFMGREIGW